MPEISPSTGHDVTATGTVTTRPLGETVTRSFTVSFLDEDNALYKSNANGFEH